MNQETHPHTISGPSISSVSGNLARSSPKPRLVGLSAESRTPNLPRFIGGRLWEMMAKLRPPIGWELAVFSAKPWVFGYIEDIVRLNIPAEALMAGSIAGKLVPTCILVMRKSHKMARHRRILPLLAVEMMLPSWRSKPVSGRGSRLVLGSGLIPLRFPGVLTISHG